MSLAREIDQELFKN